LAIYSTTILILDSIIIHNTESTIGVAAVIVPRDNLEDASDECGSEYKT
jgi:hypothetical protein